MKACQDCVFKESILVGINQQVQAESDIASQLRDVQVFDVQVCSLD